MTRFMVAFFRFKGNMMSEQPIQANQLYWVTVENSRFMVRAIRPAMMHGWWHCEGEKTGDTLVVPEDRMTPATDR